MTLFGWIWRGVILFAILTVIYVALTLINRFKERDRLKTDYKESGSIQNKEEYLDAGMAQYNKSLKAKLVLGVYLVPLAIGALLTYLAQQ